MVTYLPVSYEVNKGFKEKRVACCQFFTLLTRFLLLVGPSNFPKDGSFEANKGKYDSVQPLSGRRRRRKRRK